MSSPSGHRLSCHVMSSYPASMLSHDSLALASIPQRLVDTSPYTCIPLHVTPSHPLVLYISWHLQHLNASSALSPSSSRSAFQFHLTSSRFGPGTTHGSLNTSTEQCRCRGERAVAARPPIPAPASSRITQHKDQFFCFHPIHT